MEYTTQLKNTTHYIAKFFEEHSSPNLTYHNLEHTKKVVKRVKEIASNYPFEADDVFVLEVAAWFHDTGQLLSHGEGHEAISVTIMKEYFQKSTLDSVMIAKIEQCILATKTPQQPQSFLDMVLCDADTYNLGTDEFVQTDALLKREYELRGLPVEDWDENTLKFLLQHQYFTSYCKEQLADGKRANIDLVRERLTHC